jgi:post-segregation antitoxin (ccd killing protein)
MVLTIDIPEKVVERAAALGLPVSALVSQALNEIGEEPIPEGLCGWVLPL